MSFDPLVNFCGEQPGFPEIRTSPSGGVTVRRELLVWTGDVMNWMIYFLTDPIDPYVGNGNLWTMSTRPFEKAERTAGNVYIYGPGVVLNEFSLLSLEYESVGCRWYPGQGVVKEESEPREQHEPVGILKVFNGTSGSDTLTWQNNDSGTPPSNSIYYGEHPEYPGAAANWFSHFPCANKH